MATLLLGTERTPATRITGYFENLSDSKFKVVQLAKMRSKRSLLKYFIHFVLISNVTIL